MKLSDLPYTDDLEGISYIGVDEKGCLKKIHPDDLAALLCSLCAGASVIDINFKYSLNPEIRKGDFNLPFLLQNDYKLELVTTIRLSNNSIHKLSVKEWFEKNIEKEKYIYIKKSRNPNIFGFYKVKNILYLAEETIQIDFTLVYANGHLQAGENYTFSFYPATALISNVGAGIPLAKGENQIRTLKTNDEIKISITANDNEIKIEGVSNENTGNGIKIYKGKNNENTKNLFRSIKPANEELKISEDADHVYLGGMPLENVGNGEKIYKGKNNENTKNLLRTLKGENQWINVNTINDTLQISMSQEFKNWKNEVDTLLSIIKRGTIFLWPLSKGEIPPGFEIVRDEDIAGLNVRFYKEGDAEYGQEKAIIGNDTVTVFINNMPSHDHLYAGDINAISKFKDEEGNPFPLAASDVVKKASGEGTGRGILLHTTKVGSKNPEPLKIAPKSRVFIPVRYVG